MFKNLYIPKGITAYLSSFFRIKNKKEDKYGFGGGKVISLIGEHYNVDPDFKEESEDGEFFLNIRFKPLSPVIKEAKIVNDSELKEIRKNSDDLLNIFIPIGRLNNFGQVYDGGYINQELLLTKRGNERRMSGVYDEGRVYIAGHLARSVGRELIKCFKNQTEEMGEGDFLFLNFEGSVSYDQSTEKEDFYLGAFGLTKGSEDSAQISTSFYFEDTGTNGGRTAGSFDLSFNYPIGQVVDGNFLTFARGNVTLTLLKTGITYYKTIESIEGCDHAVYETKTTYSIYPSFE